MIINIQQNLDDIVDKLKRMRGDIDKNYSDWNLIRDKLLEEIRLLEAKKNSLLKENQVQLESTTKKELELTSKELELAQREQKCIKMEEDLRKEIEEERKVSIVKNIQSQLKDKINENELLTKQLNFYKRNGELLNVLINKYNLNSENITAELLEATIVGTKRLEEEAKKQESKRVEEAKRLEEEAKQPDEEDGVVVEDFEYKGILYYIDNISGDIYSRLENDDVGDLIGHRDNKGKVKFQKKK